MESLPVVAVIGVGSLGCYIASEIVSHGAPQENADQVYLGAGRAGIRSIYLHKSGITEQAPTSQSVGVYDGWLHIQFYLNTIGLTGNILLRKSVLTLGAMTIY